jgi:hypothetical protein
LGEERRDALRAEREVRGHARLASVEAAERRLESQLVLENHVGQVCILVVVELEHRASGEAAAVVGTAVRHGEHCEVGAVAAREPEGVCDLFVLRHWHVLKGALLSCDLCDEGGKIDSEAIWEDESNEEYRRQIWLTIESERVLRKCVVAAVA